MDFDHKGQKIFYGWYIVVACLLITLYTGGIVHFGFTAVFEPIAQEFGWSYAQISLAASLRGLEMGLLAPFIGMLVDRWGARILLLGGVIITSLGLMLLGHTTSLGMFYGAFGLLAIGTSTCSSKNPGLPWRTLVPGKKRCGRFTSCVAAMAVFTPALVRISTSVFLFIGKGKVPSM